MSAEEATEWSAGINWYLNPNVKWQFDYANTFFNGGAGTTAVPEGPAERKRLRVATANLLRMNWSKECLVTD